MREPTSSLREMPAPAVRASPVTGVFSRPWLRSYATAGAMGAFLTFVGANGSASMPLLLRLGYWETVMLGGTLIAGFVASRIELSTRFNVWQEMVVMTAAVTPLISVMVWLVTAAFMRHVPQVSHLPYFLLPVGVIALVMAALHTQMSSVPIQSHAFPEARMAEPGAAFRERLGFKYRHADIYALSAEDHYLRVHTSAGETLILMRLYDAIRELDGIEGSQTHRSWWVAKDAVTDARRSDGRITLLLKGGASAPVSRSYAKALKGDGWL